MKKQTLRRNSRGRAIVIGAAIAVVSLVAIFGYRTLTPVNASGPVLAFPHNDFVKAVHSKGGYVFVSKATGSVKGMRGTTPLVNPTYTYKKGEVVSFHLINEDTTDAVHNFNIDEFGVHTRDLGNFAGETVTFVADKAGTFEYYCSLHPEMKGAVTVEE